MIGRVFTIILVFSALAFAQVSNISTESEINEAKRIGFGLLRSQDWAGADKALGKLPKSVKADPVISYALGLANFNLGEVEKSSAYLDNAISNLRISKNNPKLLTESLILSAIISSRLNRNNEAVAKLEEALVLSPENFDVNFGLARAVFGNSDYKRAEVFFAKASALRPNDKRVKFFHATTLEKLGKNEIALSMYRKMITDDPNDLNANLGLGVLLSKMDGENSIEASKALQKVVRRNPNHYEAQVTLGKNLIKQKNFKEAIVHLEKAASLKPENPEPLYQLVIAYRRAGMAEKSKNAAKRVKEIHGNRRGTGKT